MPNIKLKTSNTPGQAPSDLVAGEIALNSADGTLYIGDAGGNPVKILGTVGKYPSNAVTISGGTIDGTAIGASTASSVTANNLRFNGGTQITGFSNDSNLGTSDSLVPTEDAVRQYTDNKGATLKNIITFTGNGTYNKSGNDVTQLRVICIGGGGGGRGYGESGGAGGFGERWIDATGISSVSVSVGGGGGGGNYYGYSGRGGTTSFGSYVSASGGYGANNNQNHTGGHGGIGSSGNINFYGGGGCGHINCHSASYHNPGWGGSSYFGGGQAGSHYTSRSTDTGAYGAGGTGTNWYWNGNGYYDVGFNGRGGVCIVYEYK